MVGIIVDGVSEVLTLEAADIRGHRPISAAA